jgi:L-aminopeptidase/D-esterase-like protein
LGTATVRGDDGLLVSALIAVNAFGDAPGGPRGTFRRAPFQADPEVRGHANPDLRSSTTIGMVATNASLDKLGCLLMAQSGHDGLARAVVPVHTTVDGDALVAAAVGGVEAPLEEVRYLAAEAVTAATVSVLARSSQR